MKECQTCHICYDDELLHCPKDGQELSGSSPWPLLIDNKYLIKTLINRGGMGTVYQATQLELDRAVAIKILLPKLMADKNAPRRLHREALASARLNHPNIVTIYDYGTLPSGGGYLVMKLLQGYSLSKRLRLQKYLPFELIFNIMFQICHAMDTAHRAGVVHCDLKPENIFLEENQEEFVQILDFGIAKLSEQLVGITLSGTILGTPLYMSPEQLESREVDFRTDIYSLGIILYEMLTGTVPFYGKTPSAIARQHLLTKVAPVSQLRPSITPKLEACVITALEKTPQARQQSAVELIGQLKEAAQELALTGRVDLDDIPQMARRSGKFKLRTFTSESTLSPVASLEPIKSSVSMITDAFSQSTTESGLAIKTEQWASKPLNTNEVSKNENQLVLLVDDEVGILLLLQEVIENLGCRTMTARDGRGALNLIKQIVPDLIISDIMMPDIDGYKLWDILQADKEWNKIPLIFLTAKTQRQDKLQALEKGVEDYWTKPFDLTEVELRLKHILKRLRKIKILENKG